MVRLTDLRKHFGKTVAVDGLSLHIERGEVFGLLGPNGAGKTTTVSMAMGLIRPDAGRVEIGGVGVGGGGGDPWNPEVRRGIGVCPQAIALYGELTARENLRLFARLYGLTRAQGRRRAEEMLEMVGLLDRGKERVRGFSGGMQRRLNIAAALVHDPRLVLLDEPTAGVDPHSRHAIFELIERLHAEGRTIVYTTHAMEEAQRLCTRVGIMDHGKLLVADTVEGLIGAHGGASVVVIQRAEGEERVQSERPFEMLAELHRSEQAMGGPDGQGTAVGRGPILGVHIQRPTLEAVFLHLTGRSLRD